MSTAEFNPHIYTTAEPIKIMLFIASQGWGGAEKVFVELANYLAPKCDLSVLLLKDTIYFNRFDNNVKIITTSFAGSRRSPLLLFNVYKIIKKIKPDIVHTHAGKATEMYHFVNKLLKTKHVATKHNSRKGRIFNKIKWVTTVSEQARQTIHNQGKVEVICNGISPKKIEPQEKPPFFSIIAVGRLDKFKAFEILIREVSKLSFDFVLNIVGEGEERESLERLIREIHLEKKVVLLGHRENIPELLAQSHLHVISSRTEGHSLVSIEGLFYSDVLISTRVGNAEEILPDRFLINNFSIAEKIAEIQSNYNDFKDNFQKVKKVHCPKFILSNIAQNYLIFYEQILKV